MIPFQTINWNNVIREYYKGQTGEATWQTVYLGTLRIRLVEYSAEYLADHWCKKGHIVHCLKGSFTCELENKETFILSEGMMYVVSDNESSHKSYSKMGVQLLIIDGDFLKS